MGYQQSRRRGSSRSFVRSCKSRPPSIEARRYPCDPEIFIDRRRLKQVLEDLESFSGE